MDPAAVIEEMAVAIKCQVSFQGSGLSDIVRELEVHASEELQYAMKIARQIDCLDGMPCVTPKPVKSLCEPIKVLRADLDAEG
jgi:bacterioferritin